MVRDERPWLFRGKFMADRRKVDLAARCYDAWLARLGLEVREDGA